MAAATNTNPDCLADSAVTSGCVSHPATFLVLLLPGAELQQQGRWKAWQFPEHTRNAGPGTLR